MGKGYQATDREIIDYQLWEIEGIPYALRGPRPIGLEPPKYFTAIGAAQTFGRFSVDPFPSGISRSIKLPGLNLGIAGAGPEVFTTSPVLLDYINGGKFTIVQVMSGRSLSNSVFVAPDNRGTVRRRSRPEMQPVVAATAYNAWLKEVSRDEATALLAETRTLWQAAMIRLLDSISVPKILFWFSVRKPSYAPGFANAGQYFGAFPQFVDAATLSGLAGHYDELVECVTKRGLPQHLISRSTGDPVAIYPNNANPDLNTYYPAPEMHEDAVNALLSACRRMAGS
jgi:hypothetical protein